MPEISEPTVNLEVLAATTGLGYDTLQRRFAVGKIPTPDFREKRRLGWRLSTIRAWNPQVAARIERGLTADIFAFRPVYGLLTLTDLAMYAARESVHGNHASAVRPD